MLQKEEKIKMIIEWLRAAGERELEIAFAFIRSLTKK